MADVGSPKSKILFAAFEQVPFPSGTACWIAEEIRYLGKFFEVDVLSLKSEDLSHIERYAGARLLRVPVGDGPFLTKVKAFQRALNRQLDSEEYRLCHFSSIWEGMVLASRKKTSGFQLLFEPQALPSVDFKVTHPDESRQVETSYSLKQQEERCFSAADRIVVGSGLMREHIIKRGVSAKKIDLVYPSIDLAPFDRVAVTPGQTGVVLYLGSLQPWQGVISLLMAMAELPRQIPVRLLLIIRKEEPWLKETMGKIQMLGLSKSVEILDAIRFEELPEAVARASVCVCPLTNHEHNRLAATIPHKILVYQACRRPVVAARQATIRGLVEHGVHGLLYPPGDVHELSECIRKLVLDRELANQLGNQGRNRLEESRLKEDSLTELLGIYRKLVGTPGAAIPAPKAGEDTVPKLPTEEVPAAAQPPAAAPPAAPGPGVPFAKDALGDTAPILLEGGKTAFPPTPSTEDTGPKVSPTEEVRKLKEEDTDRSLVPEELIFSSVDSEPKTQALQPDGADQWQVQEISQVQLPPETEDSKAPRYLLGGPPFPVQAETRPDAAAPDEKVITRKNLAPLPDTGELIMAADSDVEIVEGSGQTTPPPGSPKRAKGT